MAQPAKTSRDVERDVVVSLATREPRPGTVAKLHLPEFLQRSVDFIIQPIVLEEQGDVFARLTFGHSLPEPWGLLEHHAFEVLILFKRTVERRCVAPLFENAMDL